MDGRVDAQLPEPVGADEPGDPCAHDDDRAPRARAREASRRRAARDQRSQSARAREEDGAARGARPLRDARRRGHRRGSACLAADRTDRGSARKILGRVFQAGPALSREEFEAAAAWMPLVRHSVVPILIRMLHAHEALRFRVRKEERRTRRNSKWVNAYWQNVWAMGHLVALATEDARRLAEAFANIDPFHPKRGAELQGLDILASNAEAEFGPAASVQSALRFLSMTEHPPCAYMIAL